MSHHLTNLAWDIELRGVPKLVLLALSHLAVQSTGECAPTIRRLAYMCGMSDSGVREQLKRLAGARYIELITTHGETTCRILIAKAKEEA